jgi:hypothetical protein
MVLRSTRGVRSVCLPDAFGPRPRKPDVGRRRIEDAITYFGQSTSTRNRWCSMPSGRSARPQGNGDSRQPLFNVGITTAMAYVNSRPDWPQCSLRCIYGVSTAYLRRVYGVSTGRLAGGPQLGRVNSNRLDAREGNSAALPPVLLVVLPICVHLCPSVVVLG